MASNILMKQYFKKSLFYCSHITSMTFWSLFTHHITNFEYDIVPAKVESN